MSYIGATPTDIPLTSSDLADGLVTAAKLATDSVTTVKVVDDNVTTAKILASNVTTAKIADDNVTTAKVLDNNVTLAKLADGTQGDILYYGASGAPTLLGYGTSGDFLKTQGTGANPAWATAGGGKIGQVITGTDSTQRNVTGTAWATGSNTLSVSITPTATSSKIFVVCTTTWALSYTIQTMWGTIFRDSTDLGAASDKGMISSRSTTDASDHWHGMAVSVLDSPSTTSAITYQFYVKADNTAYIRRINYDDNKGSLTAFEVLA